MGREGGLYFLGSYLIGDGFLESSLFFKFYFNRNYRDYEMHVSFVG